MPFLTHLQARIRDTHPDWRADLAAEGSALLVHGPDGAEGASGPTFVVREEEGCLLFEDLWRLPLEAGKEEDVSRFLLEVMADGVENHGWDVPVLLRGGPYDGRRLSKRWEDLVGRLVLARGADGPSRSPRGDLYKWHLRRNDAGEYVCEWERALEGPDLDAFIARGVNSTGPFVVLRVD